MTIEERYNHWCDVIDKQKTSGQSIAEYCRCKQIRSSQFYAWRNRISGREDNSGSFLELKPADTDTGIRLRFGSKAYIEVSRGFDSGTLRAVLSAIGEL